MEGPCESISTDIDKSYLLYTEKLIHERACIDVDAGIGYIANILSVQNSLTE